MRILRTNLIFILSIVSVLISIGAFFFLLHIIQNKNEHSSNVLSTLTEKMTEKDNADILEKKIAEVNTINQTIDGHFVDPDTINTFVDYLESFGTTNNTQLTVKDVEISDKAKNTIIVGVSIRGTFASVVQTVALLENNAYQVHITSLYLNKDLPTPPPVSTDKTKTAPVAKSGSWQADVSFTILSS